MATTTKKKAPAKKTTNRASTAKKAAPKKVVAKKTTVKKAPVKKSTAKKTTKRAASSTYESFKVSSPASSFMTFKITTQTIYWLVIVAFLIFFQLWIIKIQIDVAQIVNDQQVQIQNSLSE